MALTIATGFVVDDAIVVLENITRLPRGGPRPARGGAARRAGDRLHRAVDEPLAGGGVHPDPADGRHRRPPVPRVRGDAVGGDRHLAGGVAHHHADDVRHAPARAGRAASTAGSTARASGAFEWMLRRYEASLAWVLRHPPRRARWSPCSPIALNVYLFVIVPKGFFPQQDTGRLTGAIQAAQDISFQAMQAEAHGDRRTSSRDDPGGRQRDRLHRRRRWRRRHREHRAHVRRAEAARRSGRLSADQVIARLRGRLAGGAGRAGVSAGGAGLCASAAAPSNAQYQYTLQGDDVAELNAWAPRVAERLRTLPQLVDVSSDQQDRGRQSIAGDRSRHRLAARHHARSSSTTRSTTPSASARCRSCTRR